MAGKKASDKGKKKAASRGAPRTRSRTTSPPVSSPASSPRARIGTVEKRSRFVEEYLVDLNGTQAAIRAGYAPRSAEVPASRLLSDAKIKALVDERIKARSSSTQITQERVLTELGHIAFSDITDYQIDANGDLAPAEGRDPSVMRAVASLKKKFLNNGDVEIEFRLWNKPEPLKLAGRHVGLFPNKVEVSADDSLAGVLALAHRLLKE